MGVDRRSTRRLPGEELRDVFLVHICSAGASLATPRSRLPDGAERLARQLTAAQARAAPQQHVELRHPRGLERALPMNVDSAFVLSG